MRVWRCNYVVSSNKNVSRTDWRRHGECWSRISAQWQLIYYQLDIIKLITMLIKHLLFDFLPDNVRLTLFWHRLLITGVANGWLKVSKFKFQTFELKKSKLPSQKLSSKFPWRCSLIGKCLPDISDEDSPLKPRKESSAKSRLILWLSAT